MIDTTIFDIENRLTEEEILELAYSIFLELAADNLAPADIALFNSQFSSSGSIELFDPADDWLDYVESEPDPVYFAEVVVGLIGEQEYISHIFARLLICREKDHQICHIQWKTQ